MSTFHNMSYELCVSISGRKLHAYQIDRCFKRIDLVYRLVDLLIPCVVSRQFVFFPIYRCILGSNFRVLPKSSLKFRGNYLQISFGWQIISIFILGFHMKFAISLLLLSFKCIFYFFSQIESNFFMLSGPSKLPLR